MFTGMGIVFLFLIMLVIAINIMSALVQRYFPDIPVSKRFPALPPTLIKALLPQ